MPTIKHSLKKPASAGFFFCRGGGTAGWDRCGGGARTARPKKTDCNTPETNPTHLLRRQSHSTQKGIVPIIQNVENEEILKKALHCFFFAAIISTIIGVSIGEFCPFFGFYQKNRDFFGIIVGKSYVCTYTFFTGSKEESQ